MSDPVLAAIGPRLRAARADRGLTLAALAEATGVSASTISRLESGKRQPNLELLLPLSRALRVGLDDLVPPVVPDPRVTQKPLRRGNRTIVPLSPGGSPVSTFRMTIRPARERMVPRVHDGYEWLYVLTGRLRLVLGDHDLVLEPGEAAEFDTRVPHWMGAAGEEPVDVLSIFNRDGERIHVRAQTGNSG